MRRSSHAHASTAHGIKDFAAAGSPTATHRAALRRWDCRCCWRPRPSPPREAVELCGICMLIEHMMANPPPGAAEPEQLSAFWATTDAMAGAVPMPNVAELHDFLFRLFATTGHTPECSVLALMYILRLCSYHPHLRMTPRNCKRLLLCSVMVAQKNHDDAPLRNVDFATAWGHVLPGERPVSPERINAMEHLSLIHI